MKYPLFISVFLLFSIQTIFADFSGRVYLDNNLNGVYNTGDTPVAGISVTDGRNVVKTDENGMFSLPGYEKTRFITITTPSGYSVVSHYIPIDLSHKSYDFALTKKTNLHESDHKFIQITDTEVGGVDGHERWTDYLKQYVENEKISFVVHTGDICYEKGLKSHIKLVNSETMNCPVYYCLGNHDLVKGDYGEQLFESIYGPTWYSFEFGNMHYIVTPMAGGDYRPSYNREEVYHWLKNDLEQTDKNKAIVVFNHDILTTGNDFLFGIENEKIDLRKHNLKAWLYGHWHVNYVRNQNGVYTVCTSTLDKGGIDHSTSAFRVVSVDKNNNVTFDLHYCYVEPQVVIASPVNGFLSAILSSGKIPLSVNAYHSGSIVKKVSYTLASEGDKMTTKPKSLMPMSDWNWYAEMTLPTSWKGKKITVSVSAEFTDGNRLVSSSDFIYDPEMKAQIKLHENWPVLLQNTQHTGNLSAILNPPLQLAWVKNIGANIFMSSPLIVDNKVIVASADDNRKPINGVFALDAHTGEILWKVSTRNSVKNSIAYDRGYVFAQDSENYLYAIDVNTGKLNWEKKIVTSYFDYLEEGLIAENGVVYAGTGSGLSAYQIHDGSMIWQNKAWKANEGATTTLGIGDGILTAGSQWGALYGNDLKTGEGLWKLNKDGMSDRGASTVYKDGYFYVISKKSIFIIDPKSGKIITQKEIPGYSLDVTSSPLITDEEIIFGTADKGLLALNKKTLEIIWNTPTSPALVNTAPYTKFPFATVETSPVLSNGIVYFGASDGYLYGVKLKTGEVVWKKNTGAPVFASLAVSGNALFAVDFSGNVYAFVSPKK